jgi:hypothetical protein
MEAKSARTRARSLVTTSGAKDSLAAPRRVCRLPDPGAQRLAQLPDRQAIAILDEVMVPQSRSSRTEK